VGVRNAAMLQLRLEKEVPSPACRDPRTAAVPVPTEKDRYAKFRRRKPFEENPTSTSKITT